MKPEGLPAGGGGFFLLPRRSFLCNLQSLATCSFPPFFLSFCPSFSNFFLSCLFLCNFYLHRALFLTFISFLSLKVIFFSVSAFVSLHLHLSLSMSPSSPPVERRAFRCLSLHLCLSAHFSPSRLPSLFSESLKSRGRVREINS